MPLKDLTSDNDASFELSRKLFNKAYQPDINYNTAPVGRSFFQRREPAIHNGFIVDGPKSVQQKKWIGGNRDASQITANRRRTTTGETMNYSGPQSFTNPKDNNPRIDALARVRGGGASVPPKVAARPVTYYNGPTIIQYYRIVSAGLNATAIISGGTATGYVKYASSSAYNLSPGIYSYTNIIPTQKPLYNVLPLGTFGRSYNVLVIDKATGATAFNRFDVFGYLSSATAMATYLNSLPSTVIVIIATYDEPANTNSQTTGQYISSTTPIDNTGFIAAVRRCGASSYFGNPSQMFYRSAYVLVGTPGIGQGKGLEKFAGGNIADGDPGAVVDLTIYFANGQYTYVSG